MATEEDTLFDDDILSDRIQGTKNRLKWGNLPIRHRLGVATLLSMLLLPLVLSPSELASLTPVLFLMMFAISWDIVSGYTGQLSFGHAFFFAIGGYGSSVLTTQHGLNPFISILIASLIAGIGGAVIGIPALRLEGPYLSLVTLIAPLLLVQMFILFRDSLPYLAPEGLGGLSGLPVQPIQFVDFRTAIITVDEYMWVATGNYYIALLTFLIIFGLCFGITRTSTGDVLTGIREDEKAVKASGLNPAKFKSFAFILSGIVGGLAGAVFVHAGGFPNTESLLGPARIDLSIEVLIMAIFGGMGTIVGAAIGAAAFAAIVAFVDSLTFTIPILGIPFSDLEMLPVYLLAMLAVVYMPQGILPKAIELGRQIMATGRQVESPDATEDTVPLTRVIEKYGEEIKKILGRDNE